MSLPVAELADWLHPRDSIRKALAMLRAYFDESGIHAEAYVTSIAGYVATKRAWEAVEIEWDKEMSYYRERTRIRTFHLTDCLAGEGEFLGLEEFYRLAITKQLSEILSRHDVWPIWASVIVDDWHDVISEDFRVRYPKPFDLCFEYAVIELWKWSRREANGEKVALMFAHQKEYRAGMDAVDRAFRQSAAYEEILGPLAFDWPKNVIPLQSADILAHEVSEKWRHQCYEGPTLGTMGHRRLLSNAVQAHGLPGTGGCFDRSALLNAIRRFRETGSAYGRLPWASNV
jgi:hypothetical protein